LGDQSYNFWFGYFEKSVEPRVMLLHAGVTKIVTDSARKRLQPRRPVEFERSAATRWAEQAQALTTSARRHHGEPKAKPEAGQSIRRFNNFAILYDNTRDDVRRSAHDFPPKNFRGSGVKAAAFV
jgi:hypothetical protein